MKTNIALVIATALLTFLCGYLLIEVNKPVKPSFTVSSLSDELSKFTSSHLEAEQIETKNIFEFINPENVLPFYYKFEDADIDLLTQYENDCKDYVVMHPKALDKAWHVAQTLCNHSKLDLQILKKPPYFHPSGKSFGTIALASDGISSQTSTELLNLVHILELTPEQLTRISSERKTLSGLNWQELYLLSTNIDLFLTTNYVFIKQQDYSYKIYDIAQWNIFWKNINYKPFSALQTNENCFIKTEAMCWQYSDQQTMAVLKRPLVIVLISLFLLAIILIFITGYRIYQKNLEEKRLKFALEMLTHELRTPITNLNFSIDYLRQNFDNLDDATQEVTLQMFDQNTKLNQVAKSSQQYLSKDNNSDLVKVNLVEIKSFTKFIHTMTGQYANHINLTLTDDQQSFSADPYWTYICIKNILENSLKHGQKPIDVIAEKDKSYWVLTITDSGQNKFNPSKKGAHSNGLGLGLGLVKKIITYLNGTLDISFSPTTVKLKFKVLNEK